MGGDEKASDGDQVQHNDVQDSTLAENPQDLETESIEDFEASLPETVSILHGPEGSKLYLIGTAHFSLESQNDVSRVIQAVQPQIVVIELCRSRANILRMDEKTIEEEAKNLSLEKMISIIKEEGTMQGLLNILLLNVSAKLTKDLGMAPGGEFRRALHECQKMGRPTPLLHFGDRPIQVTLRRALDVLSWWQRLRLTFSLVFQKPNISQEDVEKCKQSDLLEAMLKDVAKEYPELGKVFIEERDTFLTYSLQAACCLPVENMLGERMPTVAVGVVGIGHVPGIKALWGKVKEDQIPPIMSFRKDERPGVMRKVIVGSVLVYAAFKLIRRFPPNLAFFGLKN